MLPPHRHAPAQLPQALGALNMGENVAGHSGLIDLCRPKTPQK